MVLAIKAAGHQDEFWFVQGDIEVRAAALTAANRVGSAGLRREHSSLVNRDREHMPVLIERRLDTGPVVSVPVDGRYARQAGGERMSGLGRKRC
jgi:hypothetical protein